MTESTFPVDELEALADIVCSGALTERDVAQMERLLPGNADRAAALLDASRLDRWLRWEFADQVREPTPPHSSTPVPGFLSTTLHGTHRLFPRGHAAGVLDCDRGDRARAVDRLAHLCVPARSRLPGNPPLSPLLSPLSPQWSAGSPAWSIASGTRVGERWTPPISVLVSLGTEVRLWLPA